MPNFFYRNLIGQYRAAIGDRLSDYRKIDSMFLELSKDITDFNNRIKVLEAIPLSYLTSSNFVNNTISGLIILDGTLSGSKVTDGSITGAKLVLNSSNGIKDANIASDAAIQISKIDLSTLTHGSLLNIGTLSHTQIETSLTTLGSDISTLDTRVDSTETNISSLQTVVGSASLNTTAQTVTAAINEIAASVSGYAAPSGEVTIDGTETQFHIIRSTGVSDHIEQAPIMVTDEALIIPQLASKPSPPPAGHIAVFSLTSDPSGVYVEQPDGSVASHVVSPIITFADSETKIGITGGTWASLSGNNVTLSQGTWELNGAVDYNNDNGAFVNYQIWGFTWSCENGDDTGTEPLAPSGTFLCGIPSGFSYSEAPFPRLDYLTTGTIVLNITEPSTECFLVPYASAAYPDNARIRTSIYAKRLY